SVHSRGVSPSQSFSVPVHSGAPPAPAVPPVPAAPAAPPAPAEPAAPPAPAAPDAPELPAVPAAPLFPAVPPAPPDVDPPLPALASPLPATPPLPRSSPSCGSSAPITLLQAAPRQSSAPNPHTRARLTRPLERFKTHLQSPARHPGASQRRTKPPS